MVRSSRNRIRLNVRNLFESVAASRNKLEKVDTMSTAVEVEKPKSSRRSTSRNQGNSSTTDDARNQLNAVHAVFAVIEFEPDGTILAANDNFLKTVGYSLDEIRGRHHRIFCDPAYAATPEYRDFWSALGRGESQAGEFKRFAYDGSEIWIFARYSALVDEAGKVYKVVKFATNITEDVKTPGRGARLRKPDPGDQRSPGCHRV